jgi:cold shock CspA family protein
MDLALDLVQQAQSLDKVYLLSGDGDFTRLVELVQNHGLRVEVLAFQSVSSRLAAASDIYTNGYLIPGLLPCPGPDLLRGHLVRYNNEKGFGFVRHFDLTDSALVPEEVFFHISEVDSQESLESDRLTPVFEFRKEISEDGKMRAVELKTVCMDSNL